MPVPSVPRRAAPPRKKTPKSPSPAPVTHILDGPLKDSPESSTNFKTDAITQSEHELQHDRQEEIGEVDKDVESVPEADKSPAPKKSAPILSDEAVTESPQPQVEENQAEKEIGGDRGTREPEIYIGEPEETYQSPPVSPALAQKDARPISPALISPAAQADELEKELIQEPGEELTEEEEESARRKRVAEKLGKMGGVNPLAPRPPVASPPAEDEDEREDSTESETVEQPATSATSTGLTSETARRDSKDSAIPSPSVHESSELEAPTRKESTKSVESGNVLAPATQEDGEY
jgi:myosin tail region-interacting protein MTI1